MLLKKHLSGAPKWISILIWGIYINHTITVLLVYFSIVVLLLAIKIIRGPNICLGLGPSNPWAVPTSGLSLPKARREMLECGSLRTPSCGCSLRRSPPSSRLAVSLWRCSCTWNTQVPRNLGIQRHNTTLLRAAHHWFWPVCKASCHTLLRWLEQTHCFNKPSEKAADLCFSHAKQKQQSQVITCREMLFRVVQRNERPCHGDHLLCFSENVVYSLRLFVFFFVLVDFLCYI
jgi:hypothetical protein